jgi:hypothetical protein
LRVRPAWGEDSAKTGGVEKINGVFGDVEKFNMPAKANIVIHFPRRNLDGERIVDICFHSGDPAWQ